jgi:hypothetical protein
MICADRTRLSLASGLLLAACLIPAPVHAVNVAKPLTQAYENVLGSMRRPAAGGLLITSVQLPEILRRIGLRPGDIITRIGGSRVKNSATLNAFIAAHAGSRQPISIIVVRALAPRQFLAHAPALKSLELIGTISVRAGAAAPLNPPATPRRKLALNWSRVQTIQPQGQQALGRDTWMLVFHRGFVVGAIHLQVSHPGPQWSLLWNQESISGGPLPAMAWRIAFEPGDYQHKPAVRMISFTRWSSGGILRGRPAGDSIDMIFTSSKTKLPTSRSCQTAANAVPLPLLAVMAAAMPAQRHLVLPITDLAQQNLETRLGCVLTSGRRRVIQFAGATQPVRVLRVLWMDIPRYKFWLSPRGTLLGMNFGRGFSAYRVTGAAVVRHIIPKARLRDMLPATVSVNPPSGD